MKNNKFVLICSYSSGGCCNDVIQRTDILFPKDKGGKRNTIILNYNEEIYIDSEECILEEEHVIGTAEYRWNGHSFVE